MEKLEASLLKEKVLKFGCKVASFLSYMEKEKWKQVNQFQYAVQELNSV